MDRYEHLIKKKTLPYRIKDKIRQFFAKINEKGHELQTIMFIPHSEKKIFNIHLNNYALTFITVLFLVLISLGAKSFIERKDVDTNLTKFREEDRETYLILRRYKEAIHTLEVEVEEYKRCFKELYKVSGIEVYNNFELDPEMLKKDMDVPESVFEFPDEALTLRKLKRELEFSRNHITNIVELMQTRENLINAIPSCWPAPGGRVTSHYGPRVSPFNRRQMTFHKGIDIAGKHGMPILAAADGVVEHATWRGGYGKTIIIRHKYGYKTLYAHNTELLANVGDRVKRGQRIARMGATGRATGVHVHYEVRLGQNTVNPWIYMSTRF